MKPKVRRISSFPQFLFSRFSLFLFPFVVGLTLVWIISEYNFELNHVDQVQTALDQGLKADAQLRLKRVQVKIEKTRQQLGAKDLLRRALISAFRMQGDGTDDYSFIIGGDGKLIYEPSLALAQASTGLQLKDSTGQLFVKTIIDAAKQTQDYVALSYQWLRPSTQRIESKKVLVYWDEQLEWVFGVAYFRDALAYTLGSTGYKLQTSVRQKVLVVLLGFLTFVVAFLFFVRLASRHLLADTAVFREFFLRSIMEQRAIVIENLAFREYRDLAEMGNQAIDKLRRNMHELSHSEFRYRSLFHAFRDAIIVHDLDGKIVDTNEKARTTLFSESEIANLKDRDLIQCFGSKAKKKIELMLKELQVSSIVETQTRIEGRSGVTLTVEMVSVRLDDALGLVQTIVRDMTATLANREKIEQLNRELLRTVNQRTVELADSQEKLQRAQHELIQKERMASLGNVVGALGHEIETPLGIGITLSTLFEERAAELGKKVEKGELTRLELAEHLAMLGESSRILSSNLIRASELMMSLKVIAVDQASDLNRRFGVRQYLEKIVTSLRPTLKKTRHMIMVDCDEQLSMFANPAILYQVIINLINNSLTHGFGKIEDGLIDIQVSLEGQAGLRIIYRDNGLGIASDIQDKIFEPYFTTNRDKGGSGLGMHIVRSLLEQELGASITLQSELGQGCQFTVLIPNCDARLSEDKPSEDKS